MREAVTFLRSVAKAFATMTLYHEGHPSRERAIDDAYERLVRLQEEEPEVTFTFLGEEVILEDHPLRELDDWAWGPRLAEAGVERIEFTGPVERDDLEVFLARTHRRLSEEGEATGQIRQARPTKIKYGVADVDDDQKDGPAELPTATLDFTLQEEAETIRWLHHEMKRRGELHLLEAHSVVRSLSVAMHADQAYLIPLLRLRRHDEYTTAHALNLSTLTMALAEFIGLPPKVVRSFGIAGLLHDVGKVRIPEEILNKPGALTEDERRVMNSHTEEGARIILESEQFLDVAAVVAYEHHMRLDGCGYTELRYSRQAHRASELVHVCDVFDALRTDRPYRDAWPMKRVVEYIDAGAGSEFDPTMARAFVGMMDQWSGRIAEMEGEGAALPVDGGGANGTNGNGGRPANGNGHRPTSGSGSAGVGEPPDPGGGGPGPGEGDKDG